MNCGQFGRARWGVSAMALVAAVGFSVPAVAQVNEILISATRRAATTTQDVPLAVTAYGGDTLQNAGVKDVRDLVGLAPSFQFLTGQSNTAGTTAFLRGVGTGGDNPGFESAVGFFVDGIYRNRSGVALSDLPAVDRVEVLRGPQGTLFGKNTSAGAISVITAAPSYTGAIYGSASLGNLGIREVDAGFTGPLDADHVAVRLDANSRKRDGYIDNLRGPDVNDRDRWMVRGQALIDMNDTSSFRAIFDVAQTNEHCCGAVTVKRGTTALAIDALKPLTPGLIGVLGTGAFGLPGYVAPNAENRRMTVTPGRDYGEGVDEWGVSGEYNAKIWGDVNFTSITSYRDWRALRNQDIDFNDLDRAYRKGYKVGFKTFTQELRFQGKSGAIDWLFGGYYARENLALRDTIRTGVDAARYVDALALGANAQLAAFGFTTNQIYNTIPGFAATPWLTQAMGILGAPAGGACGLVTCASSAPLAATILAGAVPIGAGLSVADPVDGNGQQADNWRQGTSSWALFTHNQIALGPNWTWTVGARYNREHKSMHSQLLSVVPGCGVLQANALAAASVTSFAPNPLLPAPTQAGLSALRSAVLQFMTLACNPAVNTITNGNWNDTVSESELSGTTSLSWKWSDNTMFYVSYSRGYKAGGFNLDRSGFNVAPFSTLVIQAPATSQLKFRPEIVNSYEAGWKWQTVGGNLILNGTLFLEKMKDFQENAFSGFNFLTFNVPRAVSRGAEIDLFAIPHREITWQGGLTYLEAFFDSDVTGAGGALLVRKGDVFSFAPRWSATSAVTWTHPWGANTNFIMSADARWQSGSPTQGLASARDISTYNNEFVVVNGRLGFAGAKGGWALELWGKNLFDKLYFLGGFAVTEQTGTYNIYPSMQRTYGVTGRIRF